MQTKILSVVYHSDPSLPITRSGLEELGKSMLRSLGLLSITIPWDFTTLSDSLLPSSQHPKGFKVSNYCRIDIVNRMRGVTYSGIVSIQCQIRSPLLPLLMIINNLFKFGYIRQQTDN